MARKRGHGGGGHASGERWLLTYADLITLLLAFFVIMYALSQVDKKKYDTLAQSLQQSFHVLNQGGSQLAPFQPASVNPQIIPAIVPIHPAEQQEFQRILLRIDKIAKKSGLQAAIVPHIDQRGLDVSINSGALFAPGDDQILPPSRQILDKIAEAIAASPDPIRVEGFTDDTPIHTERFPSNWELSTARATTVLRFLIRRHHFPPDRLSAAGYGQYHALFPNDTPAHRALNRRVDIVLLRTNTVDQEPTASRSVP